MSRSDEQIQKESTRRINADIKKALPPTTTKGGSVADWTNASAALALELVCLVASQGGAVRYGYTRDGGAYSIGIYLGEDSQTYYCNEKEGIDGKLEELTRFFKK